MTAGDIKPVLGHRPLPSPRRTERLCRYVLRPPFAQERLRRRGDGRVALELTRAWHDGTQELVFEPLEFLERLAAMTPTTTSHYTW